LNPKRRRKNSSESTEVKELGSDEEKQCERRGGEIREKEQMDFLSE